MATDQHPAGTPARESVIEFGVAPDGFRPGRPRRGAAGLAAGLAADRRVVPLAAALGGVALFGSLISEWQITSVDMTAFGGVRAGNRPITAGIADLDGWGGGYLAGLFVLVAATVLVLFGPAQGRRYARLVGLSSGGVLMGMLVAIAESLKSGSRALELVYTLALSSDEMQLSYGRGLWCAAVGVAATTLALYLAGRHVGEVGATERDADRPAGPPVPPVPPVWSWRRPRSIEDDGPAPAEPLDLTVTPAPYTSLADDHRDKPTGRSGGISG